MPFKDKQEILFPDDETQNVMLLFGDNMRGKTSILNAIRWGFYGVALGRHLRQIPRLNLVNRDAADEDDWTMSVFLCFEHHGKRFELNRRIEKRENISKPKNDADFKQVEGLRVDGAPILGDSINNEINQVMPREVSRFFLFDGELLQEYENLLIEESDQGRKIKKHIESVLGVPALVHARDELQILLKDARTMQRKDAQKDSELRSFAQDLKSTEIKLNTLESNLEKLNSKHNEFEGHIDEFDDFLKNTEAVQSRKLELIQLDAEQKSLENEIKQCNEDTHRLLKTVWKDVLYSSVKTIVHDMKEKHQSLQKTMNDAIRVRGEVDGLKHSLEHSKVCSTCGQELSASIRLRLKERLDELQHELSEKAVDSDKLTAIKNTINNLEDIRSEGEIKRITSNMKKATKKKVDLIGVESRRDGIQEEIKGFDTDAIMQKRKDKERYEKLLNKVKDEIEEDNGKKDKILEKQEKISNLIAKHSGGRSSISNQRVDRLGQLEKIFAEGISQLRLKLKDDVERHASKTFKQLTTEKTYSGLQINKSYGLAILDKGGRVINERSAGAEQVVALSLIDGLNKTSGTKAPIVMDTPLGRLDPKHRKNILKYLPDMSEQVVLLVHEGEIRAKQDLETIATRIGARYELKRISSTRSVIDRMI